MLRFRSLIFAILLFFITSIALVQEDKVQFDPPELGSIDMDAVAAIVLDELPVLPEVTDTARQLYAQAIENGQDPYVFSKVGDCMTATTEQFLGPFDSDVYDLQEYDELQEVLNYFSVPARPEGFEFNSFSNPGLATSEGFNTASVLDSLWADPNWCQANESPLACEYRTSRPTFSLIMFGTNDVMFFEPDAFDFYLRSIVLETIDNNIVPILYTIPKRPEFPDKTLLFNQVIASIAQDYDLPLVNLWLAIQDLPNEGVDEVEPIHLSAPEEGNSGQFTAENLQSGYTVRNLITLQTLQILMDDLINEETS